MYALEFFGSWVTPRVNGPRTTGASAASTRDRSAAVYSDALASYVGIHPNHDSVNHKNEEWVRGDVHTQTVESAWSLLKRSIVGSYHQLSARHLPAYLEEMEWRFNNRDNPFMFRDTMRTLINSANLPYQELVR